MDEQNREPTLGFCLFVFGRRGWWSLSVGGCAGFVGVAGWGWGIFVPFWKEATRKPVSLIWARRNGGQKYMVFLKVFLVSQSRN